MIGVDVEVSSGVYETISTYSKIIYEKPLNGNGFFDIVVAGNDTDYFTKFSNGKTIKIFKNGSIDFYGVIEKTSNTSQGYLRIEGVELGAKLFSQAMASKEEYLNPNVTTVVADLIGNVSGVSSGTITSKTVPSFRTEVNQSCLSALHKLSELSDQDWYFSYSGSTPTVSVNLVTHAGSVSSVGQLNGISDLGLITKETDDTKKVKKVTVIGAGTGSSDQEITGIYSSGYSAGDPEKTIVDKSIISEAEANERAELEYNILSASRYVYGLKVLDANRVYDVGDVLHITDGKTDTDTDVRITNIKRTVSETNEKLDLEVRGTGERSRNEDLLAGVNLLAASKRDADTMKQGTGSATTGVTGDSHLHADGTLGTDTHLHADGTYGADSHLHSDGSYSADSHLHSDGTYSADSHPHGDGSYSADSTTSNANSSETLSGHNIISGQDKSWDTSWDNGSVGLTLPSSFQTCFVMVEIASDTGSLFGNSSHFRLKDSASAKYSPDSTGIYSYVNWLDDGVRNFLFVLDDTWESKLVYLEGITSSGTLDTHFTMYYYGVGTHTHSIPSSGVSGSSANATPGVSGSSANTQPGVAGNSGNTGPGVSGSSGNTAPGVSGNTDNTAAGTTDAGHEHDTDYQT